MKHRLSWVARSFPPGGRLSRRARTIIKAVTPFTAAGNALTFQRHLQNSFVPIPRVSTPPLRRPLSLRPKKKHTRNKWIYAAVKRDNKTSRFPIYEISHGCKGKLSFMSAMKSLCFRLVYFPISNLEVKTKIKKLINQPSNIFLWSLEKIIDL